MELTKVNSKTVAGIGYDTPSKTMTVKFNSGTFYNYFNVSLEEYQSIEQDQSVGSKLRKVMASKEYKKI